MTLSLDLPADLLERYRRIARRRGVGVEQLIAEAAANEVERIEREEKAPEKRPEDMTADEWTTSFEALVADMREWTSRNLPPGHVVDDSRE